VDYPKHNRQSIRLQGYDYTQPGAYFITIVTHDRACLFGEIVNGEMRINECGERAQQCWLEIPDHFPQTQLDEFVIMPDHIHGIIIINDFPMVGAKNFSPLPFESSSRSCQSSPRSNITPFRSPSQTIGSIVRGFKIGVTKWMRQNTDIQKYPMQIKMVCLDSNFSNFSNFLSMKYPVRIKMFYLKDNSGNFSNFFNKHKTLEIWKKSIPIMSMK